MSGRVLPVITRQDNIVAPAIFARRGPKPKITEQQLRSAFAEGLSDDQIAARHGCSKQLVYSKRNKYGLLRRKGRPSNPVAIKSRHESKTVHKQAVMPPVDHPALSEARTIYPTTVVGMAGLERMFVSGENHWKIGDRITKGPLKGFPIFTLTLEERATCPSACRHWRSCYGNHMHLARRLRHGPEFEERIGHELAVLQSRFPKGFAVRLHILGDFYSPEYVNLWRSFLAKFKTLFVFGFTARVDEQSDEIAAALKQVRQQYPTRFAIRLSNAAGEMSTISVEHPRQVPADAILCPQQIGKTRSCGTCGLCWHTTRRVAFLQH